METYKIEATENYSGFFRFEDIVCVIRILNEIDVILKQNIKITFVAEDEEQAIKEIKGIKNEMISSHKFLVF